jgi:hypothetical protein
MSQSSRRAEIRLPGSCPRLTVPCMQHPHIDIVALYPNALEHVHLPLERSMNKNARVFCSLMLDRSAPTYVTLRKLGAYQLRITWDVLILEILDILKWRQISGSPYKLRVTTAWSNPRSTSCSLRGASLMGISKCLEMERRSMPYLNEI